MKDEIDERRFSTTDFVAATNQQREEVHGAPAPAAGVVVAKGPAPLFPIEEGEPLRARWTEIQTGFVDEPRRSVEQADSLVAEAINHLAEMFAAERAKLEQEWDKGGENISTEDLRQALRRYRSFFDRLLSV